MFRFPRVFPSFLGFTLLELVIATALVSIMGGAVGALLIRGLTAWRVADAKLQQAFLMEKAFETLGEALRNGVVVADRPVEGQEDVLSFVMAQDALHAQDVRYALRSREGEDTVSLVQESAAFSTPDPPRLTPLIPRVTSLSFRYGTLRQVGADSVLQWSATWGDANHPTFELPKMVELTVEAVDAAGRPHAFSRRIFVPQGVLPSQP